LLASATFSSLSMLDLYFGFLSVLRVTASFAMYLYFMSNEFCLALDGLQDGMILHFCGSCLLRSLSCTLLTLSCKGFHPFPHSGVEEWRTRVSGIECSHWRLTMSGYLGFVTNRYSPCCCFAFEPGMANWISSREIVLVEEGLPAIFVFWNFKEPFTLSSGAIQGNESNETATVFRS
jgi:hypothetical protein